MQNSIKTFKKYYSSKTLPEKLIFFALIFLAGNYFFDFGLDTNSSIFYFSVGLFLASFLYQNVLDKLKLDFKNKLDSEKEKITNINTSLKDINNNINSISKSIDINTQFEPIFASKSNKDHEFQSNISIISSTKSASSYIFNNESTESSNLNFKKIQTNLEKNGKKLHILKFFNKNAPQKKLQNPQIFNNGDYKLDFPSTFINLN